MVSGTNRFMQACISNVITYFKTLHNLFYKIGWAKIDQNIKNLQDVNASQISFNYKN